MIRKSDLLRIVMAILTGIVLMTIMPRVPGYAAAEQKVVRVGYVDVPGYEEGHEGEYKTGFGYEYLQKISYYTNWTYEYVYGSFSELITMLSEGEIDVFGDVSYMPERAEVMNFSAYPEGCEKYYLFTTAEKEEFTGSDITAYSGKRIGAAKNTFQAKMLREWVAEHGLEVTIVDYDNAKSLRAGLEADEVDMIILTDTAEGYGYLPIQFVGFHDFYFAVAKDRHDLLVELDDALSAIQGNKPNYNAIVESKYSNGTVGGSHLIKSEKDWLKEHDYTIKIGFLDDNLPYSDIDEDGQVKGYLVALLNTLDKQFGIRSDVKAYTTVGELNDAANNYEVDVLGPAYGDFYLAELNDVMQTNSIMETLACLVFGGSEPKTGRIAVTNKSIVSDEVVKMHFPNAELVMCKDMEECLSVVRTGRADSTIVLASMLNRLRQYEDFSSLNYTDMNTRVNISMYTKKGNIELLTMLEKAIDLSATELRGSSYMMNTYVEKKRTMRDVIRENSLEFFISVAFVMTCLIFLLVKISKAEKSAIRLNEKLLSSQSELEDALNQANSANAAKTIFLSNMSHDIRTPLNAILGFTKLLKKEQTRTERVDDYLNKIETSSEYLLSVINNVLDMARIESGKVTLDENVMDINESSGVIAEVLVSEIQKKNLTVNRTVDVQHRYIFADKAKLNQIAINLLSNAVKYTPDGGTINISIKEYPSVQEGCAIYETLVSDNGIGMSKEFQEHIFDSFSRERNSTESKVIGTGLGMSIVKKIVDFLGGTIEVKSEVGKGTTFRMRMVNRIAENPEDMKNRKEPLSTAALEGKRILLVEDNELNAEIAMAILSEVGLVVEHAEDGVICLNMLSKVEPDYYDAILMDIQMPNLNGYMTTERIRSNDNPKLASIPIIAMTANAFEEDKKQALEAGMDGHVAKPIDVNVLLETLAEVLRESGRII